MLVSTKNLSLVEQKRLQWAKEREEMIGLCGLWGKPRNDSAKPCEKNENTNYTKSNLLPPIQCKNEIEEQIKEHYRPTEEESETSGYLSDSPKHLNEKESAQEYRYRKEDDLLNNDREDVQQQYWSEVDKRENYWADKKMYKNYKNENWAQQNPRIYRTNKNYWYGTPESVSSDDGCRLRWGDRGVGIGHLWEPVISHPDCRLPQVGDPYRQAPKWVEKGLKSSDGSNAEILIIHHPDDEEYVEKPGRNYILGQNAPIPVEVIEERERKRKKALEHQNAIKKQLEERELKRKQDRENRIREERLEEERIKKEQEIERLRYEEEQRKIKEKEEIEKKKEEVMREAIEKAEKRAREEKKRNKRQILEDNNQKNLAVTKEKVVKLEKIVEKSETAVNNKKQIIKTPRFKKTEDLVVEVTSRTKREINENTLKDSSSQFEEIQLANSFQFLNMNGLPVESGLAIMLDNPPKDNFLLPSDCVQLALLMSPRNSNSNLIMTPPASGLTHSGERTLTPSKYRISQRSRLVSGTKSTQTDFKYSSWIKPNTPSTKGKKLSKRTGTNSGGSGVPQRYTAFDRHKQIRCILSSKYRSKTQSSKVSIEDRPKWGINRPSVQYKKQSEKDPYYQKRLKERLKKAAESETSLDIIQDEIVVELEEKELDSVVRMIECQTDEEGKSPREKTDLLLANGYRMNSNMSSPMFVPIDNRTKTNWEKSKKLKKDSHEERSSDLIRFESDENEEVNEEPPVPDSIGFLTQSQLEAIKQIATLREGLKKLEKDYSNSRSVTPYSDRSSEK